MAVLNYLYGGTVTVADDLVEKYLAVGTWEVAERPTEAPETDPEGEDTDERVQRPTEDAGGQDEVVPGDAKPDVSTVRAWAKENGIAVSDKGRVSAEVYDAYAEAQKN